MIDRRAFLTAAAATLIAVLAGVHVAMAQPATKIPRVAMVHRAVSVADMTEDGSPRLTALLNGLRELGYVEGETITIERWSGQGQTEEGISRMVDDVVESRPDVVVAIGRRLILPFMAATKSIPIVGLGTFPADINLARPGGNITGISSNVGGLLHAKRLQLLHDIVPTASRIAFLGPRPFWDDEALGGMVRAAAEQLDLTLVPFLLEIPVTEAAIRSAIASIADSSVGAIFAHTGNLMIPQVLTPDAIAAINIPSIARPENVKNGILMSYALNTIAAYDRAAGYVDRILKGADPAEMPIQQPMVFDLVINLKTAREIGLTIPPKLLIQATEFIE